MENCCWVQNIHLVNIYKNAASELMALNIMILSFECMEFWSHRYFIKNWFAVASSDAVDMLLLSLKRCRRT